MDPALLARLAQMFPDEMAKWAASSPQAATAMQGAQSPAGGQQPAPSPAPPVGTIDPPVGGLGGLGGLPQAPKNPNEWAPANATDIMWLQQNNPQQLLTNTQIEANQKGYDPAKSKWGASPYNAGNGFGQALMDADMARLTGAWHGSRS